MFHISRKHATNECSDDMFIYVYIYIYICIIKCPFMHPSLFLNSSTLYRTWQINISFLNREPQENEWFFYFKHWVYHVQKMNIEPIYTQLLSYDLTAFLKKWAWIKSDIPIRYTADPPKSNTIHSKRQFNFQVKFPHKK